MPTWRRRLPNAVILAGYVCDGVSYSLAMLPPIWQTIARGNPILYMINAFRYGLIGVSDIDVTLAFQMTGGVIVLLIVFSLILLHKGVGIKN